MSFHIYLIYSQTFLEEIDFFSVQKYRSLGVTEKDFTEEYLTNFRYTIYCTKDSYSSNTGRVKLSMDIFTSNAAKNIIVSDRIGTLSQSFAAATELSTNGIPTIFSFAHYSNHKQFNFTYVAMPGTAPCLTILSSGKSVQDLLKYNKEFSIKSRFQFSLKQLQNELIELLSFFEKLNMISYWSTNGPIASSGSSTTASITTIDVKKKQQNDLKVQNQVREIVSDEKFTRVGGLLIDFNEEIETIEVQSDEVLELQKIDNADEIDTEKKDESRKKSSNKQNNSDKIQRMKDLGFDDDLIQEMLSDSDLSANDKSSDSKSFESDVDGDLIDAEVDRDGDGKMTDSESTADTVADFQQTISEQQKIIEKEVETKEKIAGILKVLQENDVKKLGALLSQVDKNPDIADKKSAKESTIIGGLLNNPKFTEKLKALENKQTYSHSIGQNNFDENTGSYSVNEAKEKEELKEFIEKSLSIRMPGGVQTMESLVNSYRKIDCFY